MTKKVVTKPTNMGWSKNPEGNVILSFDLPQEATRYTIEVTHIASGKYWPNQYEQPPKGRQIINLTLDTKADDFELVPGGYNVVVTPLNGGVEFEKGELVLMIEPEQSGASEATTTSAAEATAPTPEPAGGSAESVEGPQGQSSTSSAQATEGATSAASTETVTPPAAGQEAAASEKAIERAKAGKTAKSFATLPPVKVTVPKPQGIWFRKLEVYVAFNSMTTKKLGIRITRTNPSQELAPYTEHDVSGTQGFCKLLRDLFPGGKIDKINPQGEEIVIAVTCLDKNGEASETLAHQFKVTEADVRELNKPESAQRTSEMNGDAGKKTGTRVPPPDVRLMGPRLSIKTEPVVKRVGVVGKNEAGDIVFPYKERAVWNRIFRSHLRSWLDGSEHPLNKDGEEIMFLVTAFDGGGGKSDVTECTRYISAEMVEEIMGADTEARMREEHVDDEREEQQRQGRQERQPSDDERKLDERMRLIEEKLARYGVVEKRLGEIEAGAKTAKGEVEQLKRELGILKTDLGKLSERVNTGFENAKKAGDEHHAELLELLKKEGEKPADESNKGKGAKKGAEKSKDDEEPSAGATTIVTAQQPRREWSVDPMVIVALVVILAITGLFIYYGTKPKEIAQDPNATALALALRQASSQGPTGPQGPAGPQGVRGPVGPKGPAWTESDFTPPPAPVKKPEVRKDQPPTKTGSSDNGVSVRVDTLFVNIEAARPAPIPVSEWPGALPAYQSQQSPQVLVVQQERQYQQPVVYGSGYNYGWANTIVPFGAGLIIGNALNRHHHRYLVNEYGGGGRRGGHYPQAGYVYPNGYYYPRPAVPYSRGYFSPGGGRQGRH